MAVESQIRKIEIKIDSQGDRTLKTVSKGFADVNKNIKETTSVLTRFQNAFLAIQGLSFAGFGVGELVKTADAVQKLGDRLKITEGSAEGATKVFKDLATVANQNYTSIEDISVVYTRLNMALKDSALSSDALLGLTDALQKSFRLSGSTAAEATGATIQLSQGLASGQLRGQELRSVLEANVVIGKLLADQLGTTRGQLLKFVEKRGGISSVEFFKAIANGMEDINAQAANLQPTIQEALTKNFNNLKVTIGELNKEFEISQKIIKGLDFVFKNLDIVAIVLGAAAAYTAYGKAVAFATTAQIAFNGAISYLVGSKVYEVIIKLGFGVAGLANGWGLLAAGIVGATTAIGYAISDSEELQKKIRNVGDSLGYAEDKSESLTQKWYKELDARKQLAEATQKQIDANNNAGRTYYLLDNSLNVLDKAFKETIETARTAGGAISPFHEELKKAALTIKENTNGNIIFEAELAKLNNQLLDGIITNSKYNESLKALKIADLSQNMRAGKIDNEQYQKSLKEIQFGKISNGLKEFRFDLKELNAQFGEKGSVSEYAKRLNNIEIERLRNDLKGGKIDLIAFNQGLADKKLQSFNREIAAGAISMEKYVKETNALQIDKLEQSFEAGTISAKEFNAELVKIDEKFNGGSALFVGVSNYIESAGTLSQNIANGITQTFGRLEDALADFTKTGKFNFRDMTIAILDDLNRIIIRSLIIRPLAQGILQGIGSGPTATGQADLASGSTVNMAAKGRAYSNGIEMFANGGVVSSPTLFKHSRGMGMMGEAGSEAIMPLKRTKTGELGVKSTPSNVTVNVINQSGMETKQTESTNASGDRVIDILIMNKVKEGFATGAFDKQFAQQYGLRRRGG